MKTVTVKTLIWTLLVAAGTGLLVYADAANWFTTRAQAGEMARHSHAFAALDSGEQAALLTGAHAYNQNLFAWHLGHPNLYNPADLEQFRLPGTDILAQVALPSIGVTVPVFHGTDYGTLERGAGHHQGTSLPVGGPDTHSVITAHSGMITSRLFSNLGRLEVGDVFVVDTFGVPKFYEVDHLVTVLPGDYQEYLEIIPGRDLVTLFTCTPIGVNTHRLLVRGTRVPAPAGWVDNYEVTLEAGFPFWAVILLGALLGGGGSGRLIFNRTSANQRPAPASAVPGATANPAPAAPVKTGPRHVAGPPAKEKGRRSA